MVTEAPPQSQFDWSARSKWLAAVMAERPLDPAECKMASESDKTAQMTKRFQIFFASLPGIILAFQQIINTIGGAPS